MNKSKTWSDYTSYKQFVELANKDKKQTLKQRFLDMIAGIGLAIMLYAYTIVFLNL